MQHDTDDCDIVGRAFNKREVRSAEKQEDSLRILAQTPVYRHDNRYGDITISGDSRAHNGDIINYYHNRVQPQKDPYEIFLASLAFPRMNVRLRNVATASPTTCRWLFDHEQFALWADVSKMHEHHGFLWLEGKPGSGKSTVMKETLTWAEEKWP